MRLLLFLLLSGDVIDLPLTVRYSGEPMTWTATASSVNPGETMELEIRELVTDSPITSYTAPIVNGQVIFVDSIPRTGLYDGRVRACNVECSDWTNSSNLIFAILAPPGAPEF